NKGPEGGVGLAGRRQAIDASPGGGAHPRSGVRSGAVALAAALLVVDDEPPIHQILEETFAAAGYEMASAADGAEAIDLLQGRAFRPDALITDLGLGQGPNGWQVARFARTLQPALPVVYITGGRGLDG